GYGVPPWVAALELALSPALARLQLVVLGALIRCPARLHRPLPSSLNSCPSFKDSKLFCKKQHNLIAAMFCRPAIHGPSLLQQFSGFRAARLPALTCKYQCDSLCLPPEANPVLYPARRKNRCCSA